MLDAKETPERFPQGFRVHLQGLNDWVQKRMGSTLELLFGGVALMLLIGCANVSILLLARGTRRWQELVVSAKAVVLKILVEPGANSPPSCKVAAASLRPFRFREQPWRGLNVLVGRFGLGNYDLPFVSRHGSGWLSLIGGGHPLEKSCQPHSQTNRRIGS
jgi:hypothetical protein